MQTVALKPFYGRVFLKNKVFKINNSHNIFFNLKRKLRQKGILIKTIDLQPKANSYIYCDVPYPWQINLWIKVITNVRKNILFCFESPLVNPFSHLGLNKFFFRKIYTWDDSKVDNQKYFKFFIPQLTQKIRKTRKFTKKKFLVMVIANKKTPPLFDLLSSYKNDLYKRRREAIEFFEKNAPQRLNLFGRGWQSSPVGNYQVYKGEIKGNDKLEVLAAYKFCLCYENAVAPGYITEKIFDCFQGGCVPVYLGAPNVEKYLDKRAFIDFGDFNSYSKLIDFLEKISEKDYDQYLFFARKMLVDKKFITRWFEEGFERVLHKAVNEK